jgi:ATPase subunit of ABC transporter with duplicated ATPase domains
VRARLGPQRQRQVDAPRDAARRRGARRGKPRDRAGDRRRHARATARGLRRGRAAAGTLSLSRRPAGEEARTLLAKFGLGAGHIARPCSTLSPGERTRAHLTELQARRVNLLVLDEPTNHLDLEAAEQLEAALESYEGTVVLVTHDRRFLERFGATRTIAL